jgi:hypothetical protein
LGVVAVIYEDPAALDRIRSRLTRRPGEGRCGHVTHADRASP